MNESSPVCFQVSLKSLQVYDEYGVSDDPLQLQGQVRELKGKLENQTKVILQMQSLLRHSSLSGDLANASDSSTTRDHEGPQKERANQEISYASGVLREKKDGQNQARKDKIGHLNVELERERTQNRIMSEQLQQTRSRSTSPARSAIIITDYLFYALFTSRLVSRLYSCCMPSCSLHRLDSLVQSQARELSQLRQQIKESRRLGALQRQQLEELGKAFKELLQASEVDYYMGEAVKEQLDKSLGILDRLDGRLDKGSCCLNWRAN